jgi:hypothetical protein
VQGDGCTDCLVSQTIVGWNMSNRCRHRTSAFLAHWLKWTLKSRVVRRLLITAASRKAIISPTAA